MNADREARYTWDESNTPELVEEGDGEELDLESLSGGLERRKATDADGASSITALAQDVRDYHALPVRVESRKGDVRTGVTEQGKAWRSVMPAEYGFIEGVMGADGDNIDVYIGPEPESNNVYVVDQRVLYHPERFDEHKVMLGFSTEESALEAYTAGHSHAPRVFMAITPFTVPTFRKWLKTADLTKPCTRAGAL